MAFTVTICDLETGETEVLHYDFIERTKEVGFRRLDPDDGGSRPPELCETGAKRLLLKAYSGDGMQNFDDFDNFTDDTGGEPDAPPSDQ